MADKWSSLSQRNSETLCKISQKYIPEEDRELGYLYSLTEGSWSRKWQPTPVFFPGEFHEFRSLVGYGSWGCKESAHTYSEGYFWGNVDFLALKVLSCGSQSSFI